MDVFVLETGDSTSKETVLLLHGFPTSSLDFRKSAPGLARFGRVVIHDHPGFGLSAKPASYSYSIAEQASVAVDVWRSLGVEQGHLVAHDYGTSVATELLARSEEGKLPVSLRSVTLSNGSIHLEMARLRLSQRILRHPLAGPVFARFASGGFAKRRLRNLWGDPTRADSAELDALVEAMIRGGGRQVLPKISRYLDERIRFERRWVGALERLRIPAHVLWGWSDPVAVPGIGERLASEIPGARLTRLEGLGHYPMIEDPARWAGAAVEFFFDAGVQRS